METLRGSQDSKGLCAYASLAQALRDAGSAGMYQELATLFLPP